jgi:hypothetical protein
MAFDAGPLSAEDPELRRAAMAKLEESAVADARKGDTYGLMDYVAHHLPASPLRSYLLDILLHNVEVPKPRQRSVEARRTYHRLAFFAGMCERAGMGPAEAVRYTQDHFRRAADGTIERCDPGDGGLVDDKIVWRARERSPFSDRGFVNFYLEQQCKTATDSK